MSCRICKRQDERGAQARAEWGCDKPTEHPVFELQCRRCLGYPGDETCPHCKGHGYEGFHRCPLALLQHDTSVSHFFIAFDLLQTGILPAVGGLLDQSNRFLEYAKLAQSAKDDLRKDDE